MNEYHDLVKSVLRQGSYTENRTAVDTISKKGHMYRIDLQKGFPLLTTKKMSGSRWKQVVNELLLFLRGETRLREFVKRDVNIWNEWPFQNYLEETGKASEFEQYSSEWFATMKEFVERIKTDDAFAERWGDLGPIYSKQWRAWEGADGKQYDQVSRVIEQIREKPQSRRHLVSAWKPDELDEMALPPCHTLYQFHVDDGKLSCQLYQRSADVALGVPFNIASYSLLTHIMTQEVNRNSDLDLEVGEFIHVFGDAHVYCGAGDRGRFYRDALGDLQEDVKAVDDRSDFAALADRIRSNAPEEQGRDGLDHVPGLLDQLSREAFPRPDIAVADKPFDELLFDDVELSDYESHDGISFSVAV